MATELVATELVATEAAGAAEAPAVVAAATRVKPSSEVFSVLLVSHKNTTSQPQTRKWLQLVKLTFHKEQDCFDGLLLNVCVVAIQIRT